MDPLSALLFAAGLVSLLGGARLLVDGASGVAARAGLSPLVIGLTVVAFGTSAPELAVSVGAAVRDQADIALGNVVGSNIFNILLILGVAASLVPLVVSGQLVRFDVPVLIAASAALYVLALDGRIGRLDGTLFAAALIGYLFWSYRIGRREPDAESRPSPDTVRSWPLQVGAIVLGLVLLVLGANWLVDAAVDFALALGISELVIGLTVVAAGTSLPEMATSVIAALRGERDIAVGNAVGSSIFNILCVLGFAALIAPDGIGVAPAAINFDVPVMVATAIACLPIFFTGHCIARWEGLLFFGYFLAYLSYVVLDATGHDAQEPLGAIMLGFVLPLTVLTLGVLTVRALRGSPDALR